MELETAVSPSAKRTPFLGRCGARRKAAHDPEATLESVFVMTSFADRLTIQVHAIGAKLLLIQIVFFQEFGPEILWRSGNVWPTLWRKVHEIPIRPHRVHMIRRQFSSPKMKDFSILPPKYMHYWPLHIIGVSLAFVIGLIGRVRSGNQRNLRPSTLFGPRIDSIGRGALAIATNAAS